MFNRTDLRVQQIIKKNNILTEKKSLSQINYIELFM